MLASLGPNLEFLANQTNTPISEFNFMVSIRSAGYVIGSLVGGRMYDRFHGHAVVAITLFIAGLALGVIPLINHFAILVMAIITQGFTLAILDTGQCLMLWLLLEYDKPIAPYMQCLHMFFAIGAFGSPFTVALTDEANNDLFWSAFSFRSYWNFYLCNFLGTAPARSSFFWPSPASSYQMHPCRVLRPKKSTVS